MNNKFDLLVIGGGSGGIATANRASRYGARVAVIEQHLLGGTCVNVGCVPKKIMWYGANIAEVFHQYGADYGFTAEQVRFDFATLRKHRDAYIQRSRSSYTQTFAANGVEVLSGQARFLDAQTIEVNGQHLSAPHILIATGATPSLPDIPGKELGIVSDDVFAWEELPPSVAIIGAGYIAVEMAGLLHQLGVKTDLFVRHDRPLRQFDTSIVQALMKEMERTNLPLHCHKNPVRLEKKEDGQVTIYFEDGSQHTAHQVLWAVGRKPNTDGLRLDLAGVEQDAKGHILVDAYQETNVKGIFALGDVTGQKELTPVAVKAGRLLAERLFHQQPHARMDYQTIPTVIFSHPAIGTVGLTETEAHEKYGADQIGVYTSTFTSMYTALADHRQPATFKLITLGKEETIIGLHGIGYGVDEMIQGFAVAIKMGATKADFDATVAIHPTGSEEFVTMQ